MPRDGREPVIRVYLSAVRARKRCAGHADCALRGDCGFDRLLWIWIEVASHRGCSWTARQRRLDTVSPAPREFAPRGSNGGVWIGPVSE